MPLPSGVRAPKFVTLLQRELVTLLHVDRTAAAMQVYMLLLCISDFKTGQILTSYDYLEEMTQPPKREKGGRRGGLSRDQIRRIVARLIEYGLVKRNAQSNEAQGQLRLYVRKLENTTTKNHA